MNDHAISVFSSAIWESADVVEVRTIHSVTRESRTHGWFAASDLPGQAEELTSKNRDGWNVYAGVNPRQRSGARGDSGVRFARCPFADYDHVAPGDAQAIREAAGLPTPTITVNSGHGTHQYWRLLKTIDPTQWREWQKDLASMLGSDPKVCNPERIMRLPGFKNLKSEPHVECSIVDCDPSRVYDLPDLYIPMRSGSDTPPPVFTIRRHVEPGSEGDRVARCRAYLSKCPNAVSGAGGHNATYAAACRCNSFGLTESEALEVMGWFNATKCDPAWSEHELAHKV